MRTGTCRGGKFRASQDISIKVEQYVDINRTLQTAFTGAPGCEMIQYIGAIPEHTFIWTASHNKRIKRFIIIFIFNIQ